MEPNFQTSFIPKKPMIEERVVTPSSVGFLFVISVLTLFTIILATGGIYLYKVNMTRNIASMKEDLNLAKNRFEPSKITQLQVLDKRLRASSEILSKHIAISHIFEELQRLTMKTVRYTRFSYSFSDDKSAKVNIEMSGEAIGYRSIALQSDLLTQTKHFIDPVFSNLSLDDKGNVLFNLDFSVDPSFVDYKQIILTEGGNQDSTDGTNNINEETTP